MESATPSPGTASLGPPPLSSAWLIVPLLVGAAIAVGLYIFGTNHTPNYDTSLFGQSGTATYSLKSWLATGLLALAAIQVLLALWIYGHLPGVGAAPVHLGTWHRLVGIAAFIVSLPLAYHCAFAYGVQTSNVTTRVAVHSIAGCFFYGAFAAKVTIIRAKRLPGWALPLMGGLVFVTIAVLWYTSSLWYFNNYSLPVL